MKMLLQSFEEVDQVITETNSLVSETDRIAALCDCYLSSEVVPAELLELDPFSWKYYSVCKEFLLTITGLRSYSPIENERASYLHQNTEEKRYVPQIYQYKNSRALSDFFIASGHSLQTLDVRGGQSVLDYGIHN